MGAEIFDEIFLVHCKYLWKSVSPSIFSDAVAVYLCWNLLAATRWTAGCRAQHENFTEGSPPEPPIYLTTDWPDTETALQVAGPGPAFQTVVYLNIDMYAASFLLPVMLKLFRRHNTTFLKWRWTIANFWMERIF